MNRTTLNDDMRQRLSELHIRIERAWRENNNYALAGRLANEHPDLADRLYDFLDLLVSEDERPDVSESQMRGAALRASARIEEAGHAGSAQALRELYEEGNAPGDVSGGRLNPPLNSPTEAETLGKQPANTRKKGYSGTNEQRPHSSDTERQSFLDYATKKSGLKPDEVGARLGVTDTFIETINEYPKETPEAARRELAGRGAKQLSLDQDTGLRLLRRRPPTFNMAASRDGSYNTSSSLSFEEIVTYSGMDEKERSFWLSLVEESQST